VLLLINGSTRANSTNGAALRAIAENVEEAHVYASLAELPQFNPDLDQDPLPPLVADLRAAIGSADALLICTPEYAGALPGSLKNLLDWTIGGGEMSGKPVGWINCSDRGAAGAYAELATVLRYADTRIVDAACGRVVVSRSSLDELHRITDPDLIQRLVAVAHGLTT
jgi:NAD(P)H-dependent FMN reductase